MPGNTLDGAYAHCRTVATRHYENFPVASFLLPKKIRPHIYAIYAFARHADDLADEKRDKAALLAWREMLYQAFQGEADKRDLPPEFIALRDTAARYALPMRLFDDLLTAFLRDLDFQTYPDFPALLDYCRFSANPVGRLLLLPHGYDQPEILEFSDKICSALQLINFWQDISIDSLNGRRYVPEEYWQPESGISPQAIQELLDRTRQLLVDGLPLLRRVSGRLRWELLATVWGGWTILNKCEKLGADLVRVRPELTRRDWLMIGLKLLTRRRPGLAQKRTTERSEPIHTTEF